MIDNRHHLLGGGYPINGCRVLLSTCVAKVGYKRIRCSRHPIGSYFSRINVKLLRKSFMKVKLFYMEHRLT
jgi:hypothetical protein